MHDVVTQGDERGEVLERVRSFVKGRAAEGLRCHQILQRQTPTGVLDFLKRGLKVMDSTAISMCRDNSLPIVIFNLNKHGNIRRVVTGEKVGSLVTA